MGDYEADFYAWTQRQGAILRERRMEELDWENLAEEIESMGRQERRELINRLRVLLAHLLKWRFQPERRGVSWEVTIADQRDQIQDILRDNPSLKSFLDEAFREGYERGRRLAIAETRLPAATFPTEPPFDLDWALTGDIEEVLP
jgi:hypothetical protein